MATTTQSELKPRGRKAARLTAQIRNLAPGMGRLWHNGRNDSLPFAVFAACYALTQWHRHTLKASEYVSEVYGLYGWIVVPSVVIFFIALLKASKAFILGVTAGMAAIGSWMAYATVSGITLKTTIIGLVLTCSLGIPYWLKRASHEVEMTKAISKRESKPETKVEGPFDRISWLKGAEWLTDPIHSPTGYSRELLLPQGTPASSFVDLRAEGVANLVGASNPDDVELIVRTANRVEVIVHKTNLLTEARPWPLAGADRMNILDPIPVGTYRSGETSILRLRERHVLIGGVPGSGKSGLAQILVSVGALDPRCDLWLFDGKKVELAPWESAANVYVQDKIEDALSAMRKLQGEMDRRYDLMRELKKRKFSDTGGRVGPLLVVIDELARYLRDGTNQQISEFRSRLGDVLDRGRACGIMVVAITQQPSSSMLEDLRRSFTYRVALRVVESAMSKMILGASYPDASKLNEDLPGMAYLGANGTPRQIRVFFLTDDEIDALVARAFDRTQVVDLDDEIVIEDYPELEAGPTKVETLFNAAESTEDTFPNGERVPGHRVALWRAVSAEPKSANVLAQAIGVTGVHRVRDVLREWTFAGFIEVEAGAPPVGDRYFKRA